MDFLVENVSMAIKFLVLAIVVTISVFIITLVVEEHKKFYKKTGDAYASSEYLSIAKTVEAGRMTPQIFVKLLTGNYGIQQVIVPYKDSIEKANIKRFFDGQIITDVVPKSELVIDISETFSEEQFLSKSTKLDFHDKFSLDTRDGIYKIVPRKEG